MICNDEIIRDILNTKCNVLSDNNRFLFCGKIAYYDKVNQTIRVEDYAHPYLRMCFYPDTPIKLHVNSRERDGAFILIEGLVTLSMDSYLQISLVRVMRKEESRRYFRQNVMEPSRISFVNQEAVDDPCMVINISGSGIAIESKSVYQIGDQLEFRNERFCHLGAVHNVTCQVVRTQARENGQHFYGCQFVDMKVDEEEKLFHDIFALQAASRCDRK